VALSKLMLKSHNFLLLDEPTNHLDIATKEVLEDVLSDYDGTILIISHDRYFTDKLATKILELSRDGAREFIGNYTDYRDKLADEARRAELAALEAEALAKKNAPKKPKVQAPAPAPTGMSEFRRKQQLAEVEQAIFALEEEERGLMKLFEMPGFFEMGEMTKDSNLRYEEVKKELARLYDKWEKLSE